MGVQIKGLESLNRKLKKFPKVAEDIIWDATWEITEEVLTRTQAKIQSQAKISTGELSGSYKNEVVVDGSGKIVGRVWSDKKHALFFELGTGPNGEESEKDLPPEINPVYTQDPWYIPVEDVDRDLEADYGMIRVTIKENEYFLTWGQPAHPSLYPSLLEVKEFAPDIIKERVQSKLHEGLK